jgi:hypothetical protein
MTMSMPVVRRFSATATAQGPFPKMSVLFFTFTFSIKQLKGSY